MNFTEDKVFTIAEYIEILNVFFKAQSARIVGEICELKRAASGHVYFSIKDKEKPGTLDAIIWARNYQLCGIALEVGMEVILNGHPNVYPNSGRLSFVADTVELVGEGALKKAYDELRRKLEAEGAFAPERKRPLPEYPQRIGVITSLKGAVIHDFENNLGKFGFAVNVIDSRVEGAQAARPLLAAINAMREIVEDEGSRGTGIEALVIIRGGGSLESLQAFNNEALVRAVMDFPVPVIAGIGHDQDVPLMALAADHMVSTPTAAAHLLSRSWEEAYAKVREFAGLLNRFPLELQRVESALTNTWDGLCNMFERSLESAKATVALGAQAVKHNDPARQLSLGYSIARRNGKVVRSTAGLSPGDALALTVADGTIDSSITNIHHGKDSETKKRPGAAGRQRPAGKPKAISGGHQADLGLV
ncbi:MAG TPA: exodeoxyribonuclease VII large subunit [Candidatus Paceibacterota bacterium]|nr:exodeoxyribonuclease VII large subunit [Candidatus Paceibacterota bacterium]